MELETINKLFLELSQFATAKTKNEITLESKIAQMERAITLQSRIVDLSEKYGSRRKLGNAIGVDHAYLKRLEDGEKENPSDEVLDKLGLRKQVFYKEKITI